MRQETQDMLAREHGSTQGTLARELVSTKDKLAYWARKHGLYLIAQGDHRTTVKIIKNFLIKCAPVTCIAKGIVMNQNNRCF